MLEKIEKNGYSSRKYILLKPYKEEVDRISRPIRNN